MMDKIKEFSWNAIQLTEDFPNVGTLGQLIEATSEKARSLGQFVCAINVNGMNLTEDQEDRFKDAALNEVESFTIQTQNLRVLLDESIAQCRLYLVQLNEAIEKVAQMFRAEDLAAAHKFYATCIESTQLFIEMLAYYKVAAQNGGVNYADSWGRLESNMEKSLRQILEAYRQKNYILVADLLEYELSPILVQWQGELKASDSSGEGDKTEGSCR